MLQISTDPKTPRDPLLLVQPGVYHEQRDKRLHIDVRLPFSAYIDGKALKGEHFNIGRIVTLRDGYDGWSGKPVTVTPDSLSAQELTMGVHIQLSGFALDFDAVVLPEATTDTRLLSFRIARMETDARDALKRIVRAYQAGHVPTSEDFVTAANTETRAAAAIPPDAETRTGGSGGAGGRSWANIAALGLSGAALIGLAALSAASLYERYFVVHSEFAALTAPQLEMLSPAQGQVEIFGGPIGGEVMLDQPLYTIHSDTLDAERNLAEARVAALATPAAEGATTAEGVAAADQLALEQAQLKALDLRLQGLSAHAACDCVVAWSVENNSWVKEGDRVMVLARTGAEDMRIEAVVKLSEAEALKVGQTAEFRAPESGELLPARIERITLDSDRQPRFGFPEWLRHEPTVASVLLTPDAPVDAAWIGQPIEVMFGSGAGALFSGPVFAKDADS